MKPLPYARKFVYLWQSSPVSGAWDDAKYPFVRDPLGELDEIDVKCVVVYGPSQSFKSVLNQVVTAYRLDVSRKSVLSIAQSDDDASDFSRVKLKPFLERIRTLVMTTKAGRSSSTIGGMLFPSHELIISGPGANAQNSKSCPYLITDEAHLWCVSNPGALAALQGRMGEAWYRQEFHTTTAADAGKEIDILYHAGHQGEWHQSCIFCNKLIWPLWTEESRRIYNGHEVFQWEQLQSHQATLESIRMVCPHCDKEIHDTPINRIGLDLGAQYVTKNADHDRTVKSYRYNAFAPRWKLLRDMLSKYLAAINSVKLGNLKPYEDWVKKQEVRSWTGEYPTIGDSTRGRTYALGDIEIVSEDVDKLRVVSADQQEAGGFHLWVQIDEWERTGNSKRLFYDKVATYEDMRAIQVRYSALNKGKGRDFIHAAGIDFGQGMRQREIFAACERFKWLALKSGDEDEFAHVIMKPGQRTETIYLPYSASRRESVNVGTAQKAMMLKHKSGVPDGFCLSKLWSKPVIYPMLYALKNGETGREYGIATDINPDYIKQLHSYIPSDTMDKVTGTVRKVVWKKVAKDDHAFVTSAQSLLLAMMAGFYPTDIANSQK